MQIGLPGHMVAGQHLHLQTHEALWVVLSELRSRLSFFLSFFLFFSRSSSLHTDAIKDAIKTESY